MPTVERTKAARAARIETPLGSMIITMEGPSLRTLDFAERAPAAWLTTSDDATGAMREVERQLGEYFARRRRTFDLELAPAGTPFQRKVWEALLGIPFGATTTYAGIAHRIGRPKAVRAVAQAIGANPIGVVIPCHRVIGADGALTGYAGGLDRKQALLELEGAMPAGTGAMNGAAEKGKS